MNHFKRHYLPPASHALHKSKPSHLQWSICYYLIVFLVFMHSSCLSSLPVTGLVLVCVHLSSLLLLLFLKYPGRVKPFPLSIIAALCECSGYGKAWIVSDCMCVAVMRQRLMLSGWPSSLERTLLAGCRSLKVEVVETCVCVCMWMAQGATAWGKPAQCHPAYRPTAAPQSGEQPNEIERQSVCVLCMWACVLSLQKFS